MLAGLPAAHEMVRIGVDIAKNSCNICICGLGVWSRTLTWNAFRCCHFTCGFGTWPSPTEQVSNWHTRATVGMLGWVVAARGPW